MKTNVTPPLSMVYNPTESQKIQEKAREFSSIFYTTLFKIMDENTESFGGHGEDLMRSFKADAFGRAIARSESGHSLTAIIADALTKRQENAQNTPQHIAHKIQTFKRRMP